VTAIDGRDPMRDVEHYPSAKDSIRNASMAPSWYPLPRGCIGQTIGPSQFQSRSLTKIGQLCGGA